MRNAPLRRARACREPLHHLRSINNSMGNKNMYRAQALAAAAVLAAASTLSLAPARAADAGPLVIETRMLVEQPQRAADGTTRITKVVPTKVVPGTPVTIVIDYRNTSAQPLGGVVIANPVPRNTEFRGVAAGTPQPDLSVDGKTFAPLAQLSVRQADGRARAASPADVSVVRWRLPAALPAGSAGTFAFEAVLK